MKLFSFGRAMQQARNNQIQSDHHGRAAGEFDLPTDGGYILVLKYALFILFGYYNARLFINTVPGWEGYLTAFFAIAGEATAVYCLNTYARTAGQHKTAVGAFGLLLTLFSVTHATISFFKIDKHAAASAVVEIYCQRVAFPLLFGLLLASAIVIPLTHWRKKIAAEQARTQTAIQMESARLIAEKARLQNESEVERARLEHMRETLRIEGEYIQEIEHFARLKEREAEAIASISDPTMREQVAHLLGRSGEASQFPRQLPK